MDDERARWNRRHRARAPLEEPAPFLTERLALLPRTGRALDLAGGTGRHALRLAEHGLEVTLVDVSDEACRTAAARAAALGLELEVVRADVTRAPDGPWDVVLIHHFLARDVVGAADDLLVPGGLLLWCQPTVRNLERHARPSRRWLLREGELAALARAIPDVEIVELTEGWTAEGRHEARLVLRRL